MFVRFIRIVVCSGSLFIFVADYYSFIGIYHNFLIINYGLLDCFHFGAVIREATIAILYMLLVHLWMTVC